MSFILLIKRIFNLVDIIVIVFLFANKFISLKKKYMESVPAPAPENDSHLQPLGIPRGSVRAIITIILTLATCAFWILGAMYSWPMPNFLQELWFVSVGYYVGYRTDNTPIREIKI